MQLYSRDYFKRNIFYILEIDETLFSKPCTLASLDPQPLPHTYMILRAWQGLMLNFISSFISNFLIWK